MSNKTQLSNNNTKLASLIQELQGKAAGGGGASIEMCSVVIDNSAPGTVSGTMWYVNETGELVLGTWEQNVAFSTAKNNVLLLSGKNSVTGLSISPPVNGTNATGIYYNGIYKITGNAVITVA